MASDEGSVSSQNLDDEEVELQQLVTKGDHGTNEPESQENQDGRGAYEKEGDSLFFWIGVRILLYVFTLATMKLWVRYIFAQHKFHYPKFVTGCHMIMSAASGFLVLQIRHSCHSRPFPVPTPKEFMYSIGPIAAASAFSLVMNNTGLVYSSAAYAEVIGATTPLVTIVVLLMRGLPFNRWLLLPVVVVLLGAVAGVTGQKKASVLGTVFCFAANIGRAFKGVLQQECLTGETREKFDPHSLLAWTCATSATIMLGWSVMAEGFGPFETLLASNDSPMLLACLVASSVNAAIFNLISLFMTRDVGAVGLFVIGSVSAVLTVGGSVVLLGESLSSKQVAGFIAIMGGALSYSRISSGACDKDEAEKEPSLPEPAKDSEASPTYFGVSRV